MYFCKWIIVTKQEYKWIPLINTFLNDLIAAIIILNLFDQLQGLKDVLNCMNDKYLHSADSTDRDSIQAMFSSLSFITMTSSFFHGFSHCKLQQQGYVTSNLIKGN